MVSSIKLTSETLVIVAIMICGYQVSSETNLRGEAISIKQNEGDTCDFTIDSCDWGEGLDCCAPNSPLAATCQYYCPFPDESTAVDVDYDGTKDEVQVDYNKPSSKNREDAVSAMMMMPGLPSEVGSNCCPMMGCNVTSGLICCSWTSSKAFTCQVYCPVTPPTVDKDIPPLDPPLVVPLLDVVMDASSTSPNVLSQQEYVLTIESNEEIPADEITLQQNIGDSCNPLVGCDPTHGLFCCDWSSPLANTCQEYCPYDDERH